MRLGRSFGRSPGHSLQPLTDRSSVPHIPILPVRWAAVTGVHTEGVRTLASDVAPGHGLVLIGPPGIGKTTLARGIVKELESSHRVQYVRGSRSALGVPLGAYEAVLPPGVEHARAAITYIRDEAARGAKPVLLVVDDAHDLDDASAFV